MSTAIWQVLSTTAYGSLADEICERPEFERGQIETKDFPDGEHYRKLQTPVEDRNVVLVQTGVHEYTSTCQPVCR